VLTRWRIKWDLAETNRVASDSHGQEAIERTRTSCCERYIVISDGIAGRVTIFCTQLGPEDFIEMLPALLKVAEEYDKSDNETRRDNRHRRMAPFFLSSARGF